MPDGMQRLRSVYPNLMRLEYDNLRTRTAAQIDAVTDVSRKSPLEMFEQLYELQNNQPMNPVQREFVRDLIESIWEETL